MNQIIKKIKEKREFSELPDSIVEKAAEISNWDIKETRALLRKYFGVFLTNKILKPKDISDYESILKSHISSKYRNYKGLYGKIFENKNYASIIDLGAGLNGFSIKELQIASKAKNYCGIEASGQLVEITNQFFEKHSKDFNAHCITLDLFETEKIVNIINDTLEPKMIFMFQIIDALEGIEKNFSKGLLLKISKTLNKKDKITISYSLSSIGKGKKFTAQRKWLTEFLKQNFTIEKDFEMFDERFLIISNK
jgi:hypothetical protein